MHFFLQFSNKSLQDVLHLLLCKKSSRFLMVPHYPTNLIENTFTLILKTSWLILIWIYLAKQLMYVLHLIGLSLGLTLQCSPCVSPLQLPVSSESPPVRRPSSWGETGGIHPSRLGQEHRGWPQRLGPRHACPALWPEYLGPQRGLKINSFNIPLVIFTLNIKALRYSLPWGVAILEVCSRLNHLHWKHKSQTVRILKTKWKQSIGSIWWWLWVLHPTTAHQFKQKRCWHSLAFQTEAHCLSSNLWQRWHSDRFTKPLSGFNKTPRPGGCLPKPKH